MYIYVCIYVYVYVYVCVCVYVYVCVYLETCGAIYFQRDLLSTNLLLARSTFNIEIGNPAARSTFNEIYFYRIYFHRAECIYPFAEAKHRHCAVSGVFSYWYGSLRSFYLYFGVPINHQLVGGWAAAGGRVGSGGLGGS